MAESEILGNYENVSKLHSQKDCIFIPSNIKLGPSRNEFLTWLNPLNKYSVLRFRSLYGINITNGKNADNVTVLENISKAFLDSDYRQMKNMIKVEEK